MTDNNIRLDNYQISYSKINKTNLTKVILTVKNKDQILYTDQVDVSKENKRNVFIEDFVKKHPDFESEKDNIYSELLQILEELLLSHKSDFYDQQIETPLEFSEKMLAETDQELVDSAEKFLKNPDLIPLLIKHIELMGLVGEESLGLALYLIYTSRLLSKPLYAIVLGTSSSGKSYAISLVSNLFPDECVYNAHRITPAALQYLPYGSLIHRAIIAGERSRKQDDNQAEATRALREMKSDGVLRLLVTVKDKNGKMTTRLYEQPGPISYVESSTLGLSEIFDEDKTRFITLCCDESAAQSQRIIEQLAIDSQSPKKKQEIKTIISLHHTAQRLLKNYDVVIPFASELTKKFPTNKPECRRAFVHLLSLIKAVALLHQYQREKTEDGRLIATLDDYDVVRQYLLQPIGRGLGVELTAGAAGLLELIESNYDLDSSFTASDLMEKISLGKIVYERIKELKMYGYIKVKERGSGNLATRYCRNPFPAKASGLDLPDLKKNNASILAGKEVAIT